jgi:hypothetical protein
MEKDSNEVVDSSILFYPETVLDIFDPHSKPIYELKHVNTNLFLKIIKLDLIKHSNGRTFFPMIETEKFIFYLKPSRIPDKFKEAILKIEKDGCVIGAIQMIKTEKKRGERHLSFFYL